MKSYCCFSLPILDTKYYYITHMASNALVHVDVSLYVYIILHEFVVLFVVLFITVWSFIAPFCC